MRGVHPMVGRRLNLWRLRDFDIVRLDAPEDVLLYRCTAKENAADQRLVALAQVRELAVVRDDQGKISSLAQVERSIANCVEAIRRVRTASGGRGPTLDMNYVWVHVWPVIDAELEQLTALRRQIAPLTVGAGIEEVVAQGRIVHAHRDRGPRRRAVLLPAGLGGAVLGREPAHRTAQATGRLRPEGAARASPRHGLPVRDCSPVVAGIGGTFVEYDLDDTGALVPVERHLRRTTTGIVVGVVTTPTDRYPEGITRVMPARRPDQGAGRGRRGRVPADRRGDRPGRADERAGGVVRAVGRRADRDGQRHREHGLGRARCCAGSSSSPRPAARSTSSSPASTSAPSRTGTPRRRC